MPGGSSVRSLKSISLKEPRDEIEEEEEEEKTSQGWLNLMPHCHPPPLVSFDANSFRLESCMAKSNKKAIAQDAAG